MRGLASGSGQALRAHPEFAGDIDRDTLAAYFRYSYVPAPLTIYRGVEKVFAIQAGREVRVIVLPEDVDDVRMTALTEEIARRIEAELQYPGQIKVVVIRETRAVDFAR